MLVPYTYTKQIEAVGETGLLETREVTRVAYYQSNNNPYDPCRVCKELKKVNDSLAVYPVYPRRTGSSRCEFHADIKNADTPVPNIPTSEVSENVL